MSKQDEYRAGLSAAADTIAYLRSNSNLPGPRGNLELVQAAADFGAEADFRAWIAAGGGGGACGNGPAGADAARRDSPGGDPTDEFLAVCGVVGLGRLAAEGARADLVAELQAHAADERWRVREGVAMALQRIGDASMTRLLEVAAAWAGERPYVQRAAVAGIAEPRLLKQRQAAERAIDIVDRVTASFAASADRRSEESRTLRQALAYCWSVVVVGAPEKGKLLLEGWASSQDRDIRWIVAENLKKARLVRLDAEWVERMKAGPAGG